MAHVHHRSPGKRSAVVLQPAAGGACALALLVNSPCLAQGCSGGQQPRPGMGWDGAGRMGPNDQRFIVMMIPHYRMGVMMASMAQSGSQHPQLQSMQQAMVQAQSRGIEQMSQWYRRWHGTT